MNRARRVWDMVEPIAANAYFASEVHGALEKLGFGGGTPGPNGIHYPDMQAYFVSRGACLGPNVSGHVIAAAFGVFKRPMVVDAVASGWKVADQPAVLAAREEGAVASLRRLLGDAPEGLAWATDVLRRMGDAGPSEGRHLHSGLLSLGYPDDPMGAFWRASDVVREHRGDSHIAAWIAADLDACEIGVLTDVWRNAPIKSWVRTRGWTEEELDAAIDRLRGRGLLDDDLITSKGRELRESIDDATDLMEQRMVDAMGGDTDELFRLLDGWCDQVVAGGGYPARVSWPST